ncbi:hypothetical protein [Microbacterium sp. NPDC097977]|uniref:hypothetical protein n=1 Tax=Microbacterium sp. NPDC097977 TaxID=3155686 RepID=UPI0033179980
MTIQIPVRMPTFMRVELTVDGHPELDRAIDLPSGSPHDWIVEAYRLSLGLEPHESSEHDGIDRCHHDEAYAYPWPSRPGVDEIPGLPHDPVVGIRAIETPPVGTPWLSVSSLSSPSEVSGAVGSPADAPATGWLTGEAPFREDDVNRELLRRHGVVQPFFDDSDLWFVDPQLPSPSPIATLASAVTPARRLALLAHVDAAGLRRPADPDHSDAESALAPLARLLDLLGTVGMAQDATTGWLPDAESDRLVRSLGWGGTPDEVRSRGDALVSFARRAKLIRRFKGRVVATALARTLRVASPHTLRILASMMVAGEGGLLDLRSTRSRAEEALVLLAIADGTATHVEDLPGLVVEGSRAFDESDVRVDLDGRASPWAGLRGVSDDDGGAARTVERIALLSATDAYGTITSAMREVARHALIPRLPDERCAP